MKRQVDSSAMAAVTQSQITTAELRNKEEFSAWLDKITMSIHLDHLYSGIEEIKAY